MLNHTTAQMLMFFSFVSTLMNAHHTAQIGDIAMIHTTKHIESADGTSLFIQSWASTQHEQDRAIVAVVHGWNEHGGRYKNLVNALVPHGIRVMTVDLRGNGQSAGQRGHIEAWADYRHDVEAFLADIRAHHPTSPLFLYGHSMGGLVVLEAVLRAPNLPLRGVITSSPFLSEPNLPAVVKWLLRRLATIAPRLSLNPGAPTATISRDPSVVAAYIADPYAHNRTTPRTAVELERTQHWVQAHAMELHYPYLLFYGTADALVPPQMSEKLFEQVASADKTCHAYEGAYHETINDLCKDEVLADTRAWIEARASKEQSA